MQSRNMAMGKGDSENSSSHIRRSRIFFESVYKMVVYIIWNNPSPRYVFKVIIENIILKQQELSRMKVFPTINGLKRFQVNVFKTNETNALAAQSWCELFSNYSIPTIELKAMSLRSSSFNPARTKWSKKSHRCKWIPQTKYSVCASSWLFISWYNLVHCDSHRGNCI